MPQGKLIDLDQKRVFKSEVKQKEATITIYDFIGSDIFGDGVSAQSFSDELKALPESIKQINLRINSPGGSVFDGVTIYERLRQHKANVTVYIDGIAASIASVIALAGNEVVIGEAGTIMIHKPMAVVVGNTAEMEDMINILDKIENQMTGIYQRKTDLNSAEISKMLAEETWFSAEEAVANGFADRIHEGENDEQMRIAACMLENVKHFRNTPKMKNNNSVAREKLKDFKKETQEFLARK